jgi:sugar phosphate isomerase/epimerase
MELYGVDGVEASVSEDLRLPGLYGSKSFSLGSPAQCAEVQAALENSGKRITALCMHNRFEERPEQEIDWCVRVAEAASRLGVPAVRIDVVPRAMPPAEFLDFAAATLAKIIAATEGTGIRFAIENHGRVTNDPQFLHALFDRVNSPRLGLTLDTGNFYWFGHPLSRLYQLYEQFSSRVFHTHCKSIAYPVEEREKERPMGWEYSKYHCPIDKGDIDFSRVLAILKKAGYGNDLCIENEGLGRLPAEEVVATVKREVVYLRQIIAQLG